jgi:hypothetical protein
MYEHPKGGRLSALEKNIFKYRAFEMVQVLFDAQYLKDFVLRHVRQHDKALKRRGKASLISSKKKEFEQAVDGLVSEKILTETESREIQSLIDHRNDIAHRIHHLMADVNRDWYIRADAKTAGIAYKYSTQHRLRFYQDELLSRFTKAGWILLVGIDSNVHFAAPRKTFESELKRLGKKINKQIEYEDREVQKLRKELMLDGTELVGDLYPDHPLDKTRNGKLTNRGVEICYRLFDIGKSPLAVAYLLHITYDAAVFRGKKWKAAGGGKRQRMEIAPN